MKNLEQIRAKNALTATENVKFSGVNDGEVAKKVPTMIMENGILAAATFAEDEIKKNKEKGRGYSDVFQAVIVHLKDVEIMPAGKDDIISWLVDEDSAQLRAVTAETMAYLSYLRRFAKKQTD
jgi:CRISPR type III-B/RAMP module-associated protein Cmr5